MNKAKIRKIINRYERKKDIKLKDIYFIDRQIKKLELQCNLLKHFISMNYHLLVNTLVCYAKFNWMLLVLVLAL